MGGGGIIQRERALRSEEKIVENQATYSRYCTVYRATLNKVVRTVSSGNFFVFSFNESRGS